MLNFFLGVMVGGAIVDFVWAWHHDIPQRLWQRFQLWNKLRTAASVKKQRAKRLFRS